MLCGDVNQTTIRMSNCKSHETLLHFGDVMWCGDAWRRVGVGDSAASKWLGLAWCGVAWNGGPWCGVEKGLPDGRDHEGPLGGSPLGLARS